MRELATCLISQAVVSHCYLKIGNERETEIDRGREIVKELLSLFLQPQGTLCAQLILFYSSRFLLYSGSALLMSEPLLTVGFAVVLQKEAKPTEWFPFYDRSRRMKKTLSLPDSFDKPCQIPIPRGASCPLGG